jgi:hypothetical protein
MFNLTFCHGEMDHRDSITISDKYSLSCNGNLVEKTNMLESAYLSEIVISDFVLLKVKVIQNGKGLR